MNEILFPIVFVMGNILYMFIANYIAQDVTDHTNRIFITV